MRKVMAVLSMATVGVSFAMVAKAQDEALRGTRRVPVSFHLASQNQLRGMEAMSLGRNQTIYVAKHAALKAKDVVSAEAIASRNGSDIELSLAGDAATRLSDAAGRNGADMLAILVSGRVIEAGSLSVDPTTGAAVISGLDSVSADRLTAMIVGAPVFAGPTISLVPSRSTIMPGETVTVDAYVNGVPDLRVYQLTLLVTGGGSGQLRGNDLWVDHSRADYVFGTLPKLDAVDQTGGRIGGVLIRDGVDATRSVYLGTFSVQATPDAAGSFTIDVKTAENSSIIWTSQNKPVNFRTTSALIVVGGNPRTTPTKR